MVRTSLLLMESSSNYTQLSLNHLFTFDLCGGLISVMIWDDKKRKFVYEIGLPSRVVGVRMRNDRYVNSTTGFFFNCLLIFVKCPV